jgi:hypothetical protein
MASVPADVEGDEKYRPSQEKADDVRVERSESLDGLPDPDAGKSDEERKKIVRNPLAGCLCLSPQTS